eukprot:TRINITY_DN141_c3_g1_i1.p1 TRINITY_DN141_c3_g1~~TRINITY_DN141_c3_g1_i1.p1  ORF type:complete len:418 (-),score=104.72 TRINITY_DN141_c3_g1_i1:15-1268(-)
MGIHFCAGSTVIQTKMIMMKKEIQVGIAMLLMVFVMQAMGGGSREEEFCALIESKGFPCEYHQSTTHDGYRLGMFRIPHGRNMSDQVQRPVVMLQHGLVDCSFTWVVNEANESLAYLLADAGFDVWLGNNRGNDYSTNHTTLNVDSKQFWEFSWDQMALKDLPAMVATIHAKTGTKNIGYVGHSEGTMIMHAFLDTQPQLASLFNSYVALGPVARVGNVRQEFLHILADMDFGEILKLFGEKRFLPTPQFLQKYFGFLCEREPHLCDSIITFICGTPSVSHMNDSKWEEISHFEPGGTSVQNGIHFSQMLKSDLFQAYNYRSEAENRKHYNSPTPPIYNMTNFPIAQLPSMYVYGGDDTLADPKDVQWLLSQFTQKPEEVIYLPGFAHLDFVWAYDANPIFYPRVINFLKKHSGNSF